MANEATFDELNLPYSLEAEQAVLGAILMDADCIHQVGDLLRAEHFYLPEHQAIFRTMLQKMMLSQSIDFVTVLEALKAEDYFSDEEGKNYLLKLAQIVPSISNTFRFLAVNRQIAAVQDCLDGIGKVVECHIAGISVVSVELVGHCAAHEGIDRVDHQSGQ